MEKYVPIKTEKMRNEKHWLAYEIMNSNYDRNNEYSIQLLVIIWWDIWSFGIMNSNIISNNRVNVNQLSIDFSNVPTIDADLEYYKSSEVFSTSIHRNQSNSKTSGRRS